MNTENKQQSSRVNHPQRHQVAMQTLSLDQMLPENHMVRTLSAYVERSIRHPFIPKSTSHRARPVARPPIRKFFCRFGCWRPSKE